MKSSGSPFMVNIYPFLARKDRPNDVSLNYCLFGDKVVVVDGSYSYTNIFQAMIDALYVALDKIGYGSLDIIIGECGWPTDGHPDAIPANAEKFNYYMIREIKNKGTPRFPNKPLRCFLFELFDEDLKSLDPGKFERSWGVYNMAGLPKYNLIWT